MWAPISIVWTRARSRLASICRWYFQDRPRTYAITYLVAIPVFGLFYTLYAAETPDGFYAPYAQFDPDLSSDRRALTPTLQRAIVRAYEDAIKRKFADGIPQGGPNPENVLVETNPVGPQPVFTIKWLGPVPIRGSRTKYPWPLVALTIQRITPALPKRNPMVRVAVDQMPLEFGTVQSIRDTFFEIMFDKKIEYDLPLEPDEANAVEAYLFGVQGRTTSFSNNPLRMLYFSSVVQTTLGFGDLIPMTLFARSIVTLQAILGIVFAGLFINASTQRGTPTIEYPSNQAEKLTQQPDS